MTVSSYIMDVSHPDPIRTFPNEDAAAMWLLYRGDPRDKL